MQDQLLVINSLLKKREVKKAERVIAKTLRSSVSQSQNAWLLVYRAQTRLMNGRPEGALNDLQEARDISAAALDEPYALIILADCHFARFELSPTGFADRKDAVQAEVIYRRVTEHFPTYENLGWVYYQLARVYLTANRVDDAERCLQQALLKPSYIPELTAYCYERLGFIAFYEQREPQIALSFLQKALDTFPNQTSENAWLVQVHILCARVHREMRNIEAALFEIEKALKIGSSGGQKNRAGYTEALLTAGEILSGIHGKERQLITYLEQFLHISKKPLGVDVTWARAYEMLADAYLTDSQNQKAISAYNSVLQYNPYHPWEFSIYYCIGRAYYGLADYQQAVKAIKRAMQLAEAEGQVIDYTLYDVLASAYFALGKYPEAAEAYKNALHAAPSNTRGMEKLEQYYRFSLEKINGTL